MTVTVRVGVARQAIVGTALVASKSRVGQARPSTARR
jgi:hypothetical protein